MLFPFVQNTAGEAWQFANLNFLPYLQQNGHILLFRWLSQRTKFETLKALRKKKLTRP